MTQSLKRVMYLSRITRAMGRGELEDMLLGSRKRNLDHGITGLLVCYGGAFAQVLEGPPEKVDQLLLNIRSDGRHTRYEELSAGPVEERYFGGWAMDWAHLNDVRKDHSALRKFMQANTITDRSAVYRAFVVFAQQQAARH